MIKIDCKLNYSYNLHLFRVKANNMNMKIDLFINGDLIDPNEKKLVSELPVKDKMVIYYIY